MMLVHEKIAIFATLKHITIAVKSMSHTREVSHTISSIYSQIEYELCCDANIVPMLFQLEGSFKRDIHTPYPFSPKHVQNSVK